MPGRVYGRAVLERIAARCEADPDRESCGFVVTRGPGEDAPLEVVPVRNVVDEAEVHGAERSARSSRESYLMDPRAQLRLLRELDESGGRVVAVWHSHVEAGAYFSAQDRADALVNGAPVVPGAEYLVFAMRRGKVVEARRYVYEAGDYVERPLA